MNHLVAMMRPFVHTYSRQGASAKLMIQRKHCLLVDNRRAIE